MHTFPFQFYSTGSNVSTVIYYIYIILCLKIIFINITNNQSKTDGWNSDGFSIHINCVGGIFRRCIIFRVRLVNCFIILFPCVFIFRIVPTIHMSSNINAESFTFSFLQHIVLSNTYWAT